MEVAIGSIFPYAGEMNETNRSALHNQGYRFCDGSEIPREKYPELLDAIRAYYGCGDGFDTFNLPDYRGYFLRGVAHSSNKDPDKNSRTGLWPHGNPANEVGSIQKSEIKKHTHSFGKVHRESFKSESRGARPIKTSVGDPYNTAASGNYESRPTNIYVNYIIYVGI